jgi:hypothetical protein
LSSINRQISGDSLYTEFLCKLVQLSVLVSLFVRLGPVELFEGSTVLPAPLMISSDTRISKR